MHLSDDVELVRVQQGSTGAVPLLKGFDTLLHEVRCCPGNFAVRAAGVLISNTRAEKGAAG